MIIFKKKHEGFVILNFKSLSKKHILVEIICYIITFLSKVLITFFLLGLLGGVAYGYSSNRRSDLATSATSFAKGKFAIYISNNHETYQDCEVL